MKTKRFGFLLDQMVVFALTVTAAGGCGGPAAPTPEEIVYPKEIVSAGGIISTDIRVAYADNTLVERDIATGLVTSRKIHTRTYNGTIPGPTLRLAAGEQIKINLINDLPESPDEHSTITEINFPHHSNSTNFHTHGLHVQPTGDGDNVLREIMPGTTSAVTIAIPANHNPGTFWYHGHKHGSAMDQFLSGMWGAIIITGDVDKVPEIAAAAEKILIFGELGVDANGLVPVPDPTADDPGGIFIKKRTFTINGITNPILRMRPGEVQRWRLVNAATECTMDLHIDGHKFNQVALDGVTFAKVSSTDVLDFTNGQRADFLVQAGAPGTYRIHSPMSMCDGDQPPAERDIATLIVEGSAMDMKLPTALPAPTYALPDTTTATPDRFETSVFSVLPPKPNFFQRLKIDGKSFDPTCINKLFHKGELVEWMLSNISPIGHPFHIHTNSFQVLAVNGVALDPPVWRDVVLVPPTKNPMMPGTVKIRTRIEDFVGGLLMHCHVITHEELGMMQTVVVVDDTIPAVNKVTAASIASILANPATANPNIPGYYVTQNFTMCP